MKGKKQILLYAISLIFSLVFISCQAPHYYGYPNAHNVPLFKERHDVRVNGHLDFGRATSGGGFQAAYAVTKHIGIAGNYLDYYNAREKVVNGIPVASWSGQYYDGAVGYFKDFKSNGILEIYGGAGLAKEHHIYSDDPYVYNGIFITVYNSSIAYAGTADFEFGKYYLQPSYGFSFGGVEIALSTRMTYLTLNSVKNKTYDWSYAYKDVNNIKFTSDFILFEPAFTFRGGWKYIMAQAQVGFSGIVNSNSMLHDNFYFSAGLSFSLAKRYWKKEDKQKNEHVNKLN